MISITARIRDRELRSLVNDLDFGVFKLHNLLSRDLMTLGNAGYKYIKTIIPISRRSKPHLRDSFKVTTKIMTTGILLDIVTEVPYAEFVNADTSVPVRYPKNKKAMAFAVGGEMGAIVFAKRVRGFNKKGIYFVPRGEAWLGANIKFYVDLSLRRYIRGL